MRSNNSNSSSRYLTLALLSRKTINSLGEVAHGGGIEKSLGESLNSLLVGTSPEASPNFVSHLEASGSWTSFEDLSTIEELKTETGTNLGEIVTSVLNSDNVEARNRDVRQLISFLAAVEGRALQRYADATDVQFA